MDAQARGAVTTRAPRATADAYACERSGALRSFEEQVAAVAGDLPLRLIGTSTGALVCALYAERNPQAVDALFLMSPVRHHLMHSVSALR